MPVEIRIRPCRVAVTRETNVADDKPLFYGSDVRGDERDDVGYIRLIGIPRQWIPDDHKIRQRRRSFIELVYSFRQHPLKYKIGRNLATIGGVRNIDQHASGYSGEQVRRGIGYESDVA